MSVVAPSMTAPGDVVHVRSERIGRSDPALSPREREVLETLSTGRSVDEAGVALGISRSGVRSHLQRVYGRFHTGGLVETYRAIGWLVPR